MDKVLGHTFPRKLRTAGFIQQKTRTSKYYLEAKKLVVLLFDLSLIQFYKK